MKSSEVVRLYESLEAVGIEVWIDGGWCVDALVHHQTREHPDLDLAVARASAGELRLKLEQEGYREYERPDSSPWNYVLSDGSDSLVDVHVFEFDESGQNIYGIEYPRDSLSGSGVIDGVAVRCIRQDWMFKFKTAYDPGAKDLHDVQILSAAFGFDIPQTHCN